MVVEDSLESTMDIDDVDTPSQPGSSSVQEGETEPPEDSTSPDETETTKSLKEPEAAQNLPTQRSEREESPPAKDVPSSEEKSGSDITSITPESISSTADEGKTVGTSGNFPVASNADSGEAIKTANEELPSENPTASKLDLETPSASDEAMEVDEEGPSDITEEKNGSSPTEPSTECLTRELPEDSVEVPKTTLEDETNVETVSKPTETPSGEKDGVVEGEIQPKTSRIEAEAVKIAEAPSEDEGVSKPAETTSEEKDKVVESEVDSEGVDANGETQEEADQNVETPSEDEIMPKPAETTSKEKDSVVEDEVDPKPVNPTEETAVQNGNTPSKDEEMPQQAKTTSEEHGKSVEGEIQPKTVNPTVETQGAAVEIAKTPSEGETTPKPVETSKEASTGTDDDVMIVDDDPLGTPGPKTTTGTSVGTDPPPQQSRPPLLLPTKDGQAVLVDVNALLRGRADGSPVVINSQDPKLPIISTLNIVSPIVQTPAMSFMLARLPPARALTDDSNIFADQDYLLECPSFTTPYLYQSYRQILDPDNKSLKLVDKWQKERSVEELEEVPKEEPLVEDALKLLNEVESLLKKKQPEEKEKTPVEPTEKPPTVTSPYFETAFGKFFLELGSNLVKEFVVKEKVREIKKRVDQDGGLQDEPDLTKKAVIIGEKAIEELEKENEAVAVKGRFRCKSCKFNSESKLALDWHNAAPHGNWCSYCSFTARVRMELQVHVRNNHPGVLFRNEPPRAPHECPFCFFEDYSQRPKKSFQRHVEKCQAAYVLQPEKTLEVQTALDAPAKLSSVASASHEVQAQPCFHHLVNRSDLEALFPVDTYSRKGKPATVVPAGSVGQRKTGLNVLAGRPSGQRSVRPLPVPSSFQPQAPTLLRQPRPSAPTSVQPGPRLPAQVVPAPAVRPRVNLGSFNPLPKRPLGLPPIFFQQTQPGGSVKMLPFVNESCFLSCEICDAVIKDTPQLSIHMKHVHGVNLHKDILGGKALLPLSCTECSYRFYTDIGLERHLLGSHGLVTPLMQDAAKRNIDGGRCPICGKIFQWKLLSHVTQEHKVPLKEVYVNLKCSMCSAMFVAYKAFEAHVYMVHTKKNNQAVYRPPPAPKQRQPAQQTKTNLIVTPKIVTTTSSSMSTATVVAGPSKRVLTSGPPQVIDIDLSSDEDEAQTAAKKRPAVTLEQLLDSDVTSAKKMKFT